MPSSLENPSIKHINNDKDVATKEVLHQHLYQAIRQKNYFRAIQLLDYCIIQEPQNPNYYSNRGLIYYRCDQLSQAMTDYNQALQLNPYADRVYTHRAQCSTALGHWNEAIADYDCAIDINPYNIKARIHQGVLFRTLQMYDEAIVCFDLALFLGKLSAHIYAERGRTYQLDGHWNCAMGDYQHALTILTASPIQALESQIQIWIGELID